MSVLETLTKARDLLSDPNKWIKGGYARNDCGAVCDPMSPHARQFCMIGAVYASTAHQPWMAGSVHCRLEAAVMRTKPRFSALATFNDHPNTTHQDVLDIFSIAIAAELNRENNT